MLEESRLPLVHCIPVASITVFVFSTRPWLRRGGKSGLQECGDRYCGICGGNVTAGITGKLVNK